MVPLEARTRKGDKLSAPRAGSTRRRESGTPRSRLTRRRSPKIPAESCTRWPPTKARFQAAQNHVDEGLKIRAKGQLGEALLEFQKAYAINPGSSIAQQELTRTQEMIQRERKRVEETGKETRAAAARAHPRRGGEAADPGEDRPHAAVPELKPLNPDAVKNLTSTTSPSKSCSKPSARSPASTSSGTRNTSSPHAIRSTSISKRHAGAGAGLHLA